MRNLYLNETIAAKVFEDCTYPWEVLAKIGDFIVELGNAQPEDEYEKRGENIWVHRTANVFPSAYIAGPAIIGKDAKFYNKITNLRKYFPWICTVFKYLCCNSLIKVIQITYL